MIQVQEEFDQRLKDDQTNHEDELDMLQEEVRSKEISLTALENQFEHEITLKEQQIDSQKTAIAELKS